MVKQRCSPVSDAQARNKYKKKITKSSDDLKLSLVFNSDQVHGTWMKCVCNKKRGRGREGETNEKSGKSEKLLP